MQKRMALRLVYELRPRLCGVGRELLGGGREAERIVDRGNMIMKVMKTLSSRGSDN